LFLLDVVQDAARRIWRSTLNELAPMLEKRIADDRAAKRVSNRRVRVGMYFYSEEGPVPVAATGNPRRSGREPAKPKRG